MTNIVEIFERYRDALRERTRWETAKDIAPAVHIPDNITEAAREATKALLAALNDAARMEARWGVRTPPTGAHALWGRADDAARGIVTKDRTDLTPEDQAPRKWAHLRLCAQCATAYFETPSVRAAYCPAGVAARL